MTDQITVSRETWDALNVALKTVLGYTENWPASFTVHDCWKRDSALAREALTAANAVSEPQSIISRDADADHGVTLSVYGDHIHPSAAGRAYVMEALAAEVSKQAPKVVMVGDSLTMQLQGGTFSTKEALAALNSLPWATAEPCPHCGAIHAKGMNTLCDDGEPVGINGLTEAETSASMSVMGLSKPQAQGEARLTLQQALDESGLCDYYKEGDLAFSIAAQKFAALVIANPQATEPACKQLLQVPEGYKLVPVIPAEEQWGGLARDIMMWLDMDGRKTAGSLFKHLDRCGAEIPEWLRDEPEMKNLDHVPSKGTRVTIIYRAMLAAAPEAKQ